MNQLFRKMSANVLYMCIIFPLFLYIFNDSLRQCNKHFMHCTCCYIIIPDLPDLHYTQVRLVRLSMSHVFPIILDMNSPKQLKNDVQLCNYLCRTDNRSN